MRELELGEYVELSSKVDDSSVDIQDEELSARGRLK